MRIVNTLILVLCLNTLTFAGEGLAFKWMEGNKNVGELKITEVKSQETITYHYVSEMVVNYGEEITIKEEMKAIYPVALKDSLLYTISYLEATRSFNAKPRINVKEEMKGEKWVRIVNGKEKEIERAQDVFCYMFLFKKPPVNVTSVYSELYGMHFEVVDKGNNHYLIKGAKNRQHSFAYDDKGNLIKAQISLSSGTYTLLPK
ncbi:MAG: hypothetical protein R2728_10170 [Chitinophagales bacterium]